MDTWLNYITRWCVAPLWSSPCHSMDVALGSRDIFSERVLQKLKAYDPGFPRDDDAPPEKPTRPTQFPTDVPAPEPRDVPAPEPTDDPPPDPGKSPTEPPKRPKEDPKPRPTP